MKKATQLSEIYQACTPRPLSRDQLAEFFVNTADARDGIISRREELQKKLRSNLEHHAKLLLAGHRGCGKSTELVKLSEELSDDFFTVAFSVERECNIANVTVEDVLVVLMERIVDACNEAGLGERFADSTETLKEIHGWFSKELEIDESTSETGKSAEAGVSSEHTYWGKLVGLLAKAKTYIRRGDKHLHRKTIEKPHRIAELVNRCNDLIAAVNNVLAGRKQRLLAIIEDLDKASLSDARQIFVEQPATLADLRTSLIATVPIFLLHSPDSGAFDAHFETMTLPMIKVVEFDGSAYGEGRAIIMEIIKKRVDADLIEKDAFNLIIKMTAGLLRDVFEVLDVAASAAESQSGRQLQQPVITKENVRYALNRLRRKYAQSISVINLPDEWRKSITVDDLYD